MKDQSQRLSSVLSIDDVIMLLLLDQLKWTTNQKPWSSAAAHFKVYKRAQQDWKKHY